MFHAAKTFGLALAATMALGSPAAAHHITETTVQLPVIDPGDTYVLKMKCPGHRYAITGGHATISQARLRGGLVVTGSYPVDTRTWGYEISNMSGRPNGKIEAEITLRAYCGYRH